MNTSPYMPDLRNRIPALWVNLEARRQSHLAIQADRYCMHLVNRRKEAETFSTMEQIPVNGRRQKRGVQ